MAGQGGNTRSLRLLDYQGKQVMYMDAYQIIMICLAAITLVLKLIDLYINRK